MRTLLAGLLVAGLATAADDDAVKAKLDKAKAAYQSAREKNKEYLIEVLTKQEDAARKVGKVDLVEKVKKVRDDYQGGGPLPGGLAPAVRQRFSGARAAMQTAFADASRDYTKAKKDDLADAVREEWETFKLDASDDPNVVRLVNKTSLKYVSVTKSEGGSNEPRAELYGEKPGNSQYWRVVPAGKTGAVFFQTLDGKMLLSTEKGSAAQETALVAAPLRMGVAQQTQMWQMVPSLDGWSRLYHPASKMVVGPLGKSRDDGATLVIWPNERNAPHMDWKFD